MSTNFETWRAERESSRVGLHITPLEWTTAEEVWDALLGIPDGRGWVCRPSEVVEWPCPAQGRLLSAEVVGADGASLHVRRSGRGWAGWRYLELPLGDCVKLREERIGTVPGSDRTLHYAVYWRPVTEHGIEVYRPYAARFTGWEGA